MPTKIEFITEIRRNLTPPEPNIVNQPVIPPSRPPKTALDLATEEYTRKLNEITLKVSQQLGFMSGMEALSEMVHGGVVTEDASGSSSNLKYRFSFGSRIGRVYEESKIVDKVIPVSGGDFGAGWTDNVILYKQIPSQPRTLEDVCNLEVSISGIENCEIHGTLSTDQYGLIKKPFFGVPIYSLGHYYLDPNRQLHISDLSKGPDETLRFFTQAYRHIQGYKEFLMRK